MKYIVITFIHTYTLTSLSSSLSLLLNPFLSNFFLLIHWACICMSSGHLLQQEELTSVYTAEKQCHFLL